MLGDTAIAVHPDDERYRRLGRHNAAAPVPRPTDRHRRRRARRPRIRHRRSQGHARARSERLRDRRAARPADAVDHGHQGPDRRHRNALRRSGPVRGARRGARRACRRRPHRRREAALSAQRRAFRTQRRAHRTATEPAVVGQGRVDGQGRRRRGAQRRHRDSPGRASNRAGSPGSTTCTTGASRVSCGGATAFRSGTARTARRSASDPTRPRRTAGSRTPTCWTPGSPRRCGRSPRWAGPTAPRSSRSSIRPAFWSPATTSCSSGWRA